MPHETAAVSAQVLCTAYHHAPCHLLASKEDPKVQMLAWNPLFHQSTCHVQYRHGGQIQTLRATLYHMVVRFKACEQRARLRELSIPPVNMPCTAPTRWSDSNLASKEDLKVQISAWNPVYHLSTCHVQHLHGGQIQTLLHLSTLYHTVRYKPDVRVKPSIPPVNTVSYGQIQTRSQRETLYSTCQHCIIWSDTN